MKEYQHLIGKIVVAVAIIVAAIIIAQAIKPFRKLLCKL